MTFYRGQSCHTGQTRARCPHSAAAHWPRTLSKQQSTTCSVASKTRVSQLDAGTANSTAAADLAARPEFVPSRAAITAASSSLTALTLVTYYELSQAHLPALGNVLHNLAGVLGLAAAGAAAAVGACKLLLGDRFHLELHRYSTIVFQP